MLSFFRNFTKSRVGIIVVFLVLGVIAVAFALGDVTGLRSAGGPNAVLVKVGKQTITEADLRETIDRWMTEQRNRGAVITMEDFLARDGVNAILNEMIVARAVQEYGIDAGMFVDRKTIDSEIANDPAFHGIDGRFDQQKYEALLSQRRMSPARLHAEISQNTYGRWLLDRPGRPSYVPNGIVAPYASRGLERRQGQATLIRLVDMDVGPAPDEKTLTAFYNQHRASYMVPERRVIRYAIVRPDQFKASAAATDAEIADAFAKSGPRFAATEKRTISQIVLTDQATANAVAAEVKAGKTIADIAAARGLQPTKFDAIEKTALTTQSNAAVANAAFGAAQGAVVGPVRSPFGWAVLKVEKVDVIPAKTLEQARPDLAKEIEARKTVAALVAQRQAIEDSIGNEDTFDEMAAKAKVQAQSTPALTIAGINPDDANSKPDAALLPIVQAGFAADADSQEPQLVPLDQEGSFAVLVVGKVTQPTPRPFASIRDDVRRDYQHDVAMKQARNAAQKLIAELKKGTPMPEAIRKAGIKALPPRDFNLAYADLNKDTPRQVRLAFSIAPKSARLIESPEGNGFFVVYVSSVEQHDASGNAALMNGRRTELGQSSYGEQAMQFIQAMQKHVKVTRDEAAITRFRAQLSGQGTSGQ
ncbi:SurA N-terminal domain-containing protein [Sphingomonas sp. AOB5]|uniref:peptidylprolyl isomerase n=1 Tax=Sphingomonas sp. AOB5 TaxID=3034017 RepID=UPI0023F86AC3|nr:peptidylprolyl isomerase [Sphingomonas sp. AOB5]MDF7774128.1 SurA N-terminal domain-containing protein [Sphingomonas sp. AOB5]